MGQQQLLLLVLATVIVGLATVAGIQAFDEGQTQAANDALTQRAVSIASDIQGQARKPSQLGGIDLSSDNASTIANAIGLESASGIDASGAGDGASCTIEAAGTSSGSSFSNGIDVRCAGGNSNTHAVANVQGNTDGDPVIDTEFGSGTS